MIGGKCVFQNQPGLQLEGNLCFSLILSQVCVHASGDGVT